MELGHLSTRSGLTYPEVSSKVYPDSFCQLDSSVSLPWVIYFETFYLHFVSSFSCIPVICPKFVLFLTPLQFVHLFCNLSKCYKVEVILHKLVITKQYISTTFKRSISVQHLQIIFAFSFITQSVRYHKISKSDHKLRYVCASDRLPLEDFQEIRYLRIFFNLSRKFKFRLILT